jgi:hypothetical protein
MCTDVGAIPLAAQRRAAATLATVSSVRDALAVLWRARPERLWTAFVAVPLAELATGLLRMWWAWPPLLHARGCARRGGVGRGFCRSSWGSSASCGPQPESQRLPIFRCSALSSARCGPALRSGSPPPAFAIDACTDGTALGRVRAVRRERPAKACAELALGIRSRLCRARSLRPPPSARRE